MRIKGTKPLITLAFLLAAGAVPAVAQQGGGGGGRPMMGPPLQLTSSAFADGTMIPDKYTCSPDGKSMTAPANMTSPPTRVDEPSGRHAKLRASVARSRCTRP